MKTMVSPPCHHHGPQFDGTILGCFRLVCSRPECSQPAVDAHYTGRLHYCSEECQDIDLGRINQAKAPYTPSGRTV